jgi:hypothetical protein
MNKDILSGIKGIKKSDEDFNEKLSDLILNIEERLDGSISTIPTENKVGIFMKTEVDIYERDANQGYRTEKVVIEHEFKLQIIAGKVVLHNFDEIILSMYSSDNSNEYLRSKYYLSSIKYENVFSILNLNKFNEVLIELIDLAQLKSDEIDSFISCINILRKV